METMNRNEIINVLYIVSIADVERQYMAYLPTMAIKKAMSVLKITSAPIAKVTEAEGGKQYTYYDVTLPEGHLHIGYSRREDK